MVKKKGKAAVRRAPTKRKTVTAVGRTAARPKTQTSSTTDGVTSQITIFLFRTSSGNRIRTSPQRAYVDPNARVEWTVVNMIDGSDVPVRITWPNSSPFARESIEFKSRQTENLAGVKPGVYKYVVHAYDTHEDPEIEIPDL